MNIYREIFLSIVRSPLAPLLSIPDNMEWTSAKVQHFLEAKKIHVQVVPISNSNTVKNSETLPTIFFGTHKTFFDIFYIHGLTNLSKTSMIAIKTVGILWPFAQPKILTVSSYNLLRPLTSVTPLMWWYHKAEGIAPDEVTPLSRLAISDAVKTLSTSENILIFPDGGVPVKKWFTGIGWMIWSFLKEYPNRELLLQPIYISGANDGKLFIQNLVLAFHLPKTLVVNVFTPQPIKINKKILYQWGMSKDWSDKQKVRWIVECLQLNYAQSASRDARLK